MEQVRKGMWYSMCCHKDLYQINTDEDLKELEDMFVDCDTLKIWGTEKEALLDIRKSWGGSNAELAEIDERLLKL